MKNNDFSFSYTDYKTFGEKNRKVNNPTKLDYYWFFEKYIYCNKHYDDKKKYNR